MKFGITFSQEQMLFGIVSGIVFALLIYAVYTQFIEVGRVDC